jgi:NADPH:quinone reductase-like Zn-dependent oxidoreductase
MTVTVRSRSTSVGLLSPISLIEPGQTGRTRPEWAIAAIAADAVSLPMLDAVDAVDPGAGDTVLVMGATGGVGVFAVQLAAQRGARVIASAKPDEDAFIRALGAAETVDWHKAGLGDTVRKLAPAGLAALIDVVSRGEAFAALAALLPDGGRAATTLGAADIPALAERGIRATNVMGTPTPEKLASLAAQAASGALQVPIQETFALAETHAAIASFSAGTRGKIVLTIR